MIKIRPLRKEEFLKIIEWNKDKDKEFLYQWAGRGYHYPLTMEQYDIRLAGGMNQEGASTMVYGIDDTELKELVGTIELTRIDYTNKTASIGRFLINENHRGKGYGTRALTAMVHHAHEVYGLTTLFLRVFDFNVPGITCYEKVGFTKVKYEENAFISGTSHWGRYTMMYHF